MSDILNLAVIGVAGVLVLWDAVVFKNIWKTKYIWLLIAFAGFTIISSFVGIKYGFIENMKAIANIFIQFGLLYVVGARKDRKALEKEAGIIATAVGAAWAIPVVISLYMYFADIYYTQNRYLWGETTEIVQGFVREHYGALVMRLWGVFVDPNFASSISIAIVALSLFAIFTTEKKWVKIFHIVNVVLQYLYIVLSNSRMALLILCLSVFVGVWYYSYFLLKNKKFCVIFKEIISIVLTVLCAGTCLLAVQVTKNVLPYVRYGVGYIEEKLQEDPVKTEENTTVSPSTTLPETSEIQTTAVETTTQPTTIVESTTEIVTEESTTEATTQVITTENVITEVITSESITQEITTIETTVKENTVEKLERGDAAVKEDISNGRFGLWMEGINSVFKQHMIFGVGPRNYHTVANEVDPNMKISTGFSIHNSFVELLMGNGIVGTLVLALFFVLCARDAIVVRYKDPRKAKSVGLLMISVLSLLACGMFIACLFYTLSGATIILFTVLGYAVRLTIVDEK